MTQPKPVENILYEFLAEHQADFGDSVEIHTSAYEKWSKDSGIIPGDADASFDPDRDYELDGLLTIEIYARVLGQDKTQRLPARQNCFTIKRIMMQLFRQFPTLNGRCCNVVVLRQTRFFEDTRADKYAV